MFMTGTGLLTFVVKASHGSQWKLTEGTAFSRSEKCSAFGP